MKTIAPKILAAPNHRSLAICLDGSQQIYFQLRAAVLSLAPSSAKGYYATVRTSPLRRSDVDHTVLPADTPHLPLPRSSPEGATTE